jgi:hypothetical protein
MRGAVCDASCPVPKFAGIYHGCGNKCNKSHTRPPRILKSTLTQNSGLSAQGWYEIQDIQLPVFCDDGTLDPKTSPIMKWQEGLIDASKKLGRPLDPPISTKPFSSAQASGMSTRPSLDGPPTVGLRIESSRNLESGIWSTLMLDWTV